MFNLRGGRGRRTSIGIASDGVGLWGQGYRLIMGWRGDGRIDVELHDDELRPVPPACKRKRMSQVWSLKHDKSPQPDIVWL